MIYSELSNYEKTMRELRSSIADFIKYMRLDDANNLVDRLWAIKNQPDEVNKLYNLKKELRRRFL